MCLGLNKFLLQGTTLAEEDEDPLLAKHRAERHKASEEQAEQQSAEIATIKKLYLSVECLQRVKTNHSMYTSHIFTQCFLE